MGGLTYCYTDANHENLFGSTVAEIGGFIGTDVARVGQDKCWVCDFAHSNKECSFSDFSEVAATQNITAGQGYTFTGVLYPYSKAVQGVMGLSGPVAASGVQAIVGAGLGAFTTLVAITGTPGNQFQVEYISHMEYEGKICSSSCTPSHMDPDGFALVQEAASKAPLIKQSTGKTWTESMFSAISVAAKELGPMAIAAGKEVLMSLIL